ncbi:hypothetical protein SLS53_005062 [Cytospora paraplurivora]|uniref:Uncharacterized protein n=1 Tax=Cytospora paraplurivora TaxID=2898453 RepID=A0AAN9U618_9PEZI
MITEGDAECTTATGTLQTQSCDSAPDTTTTKDAAPPTRRIKIYSNMCGQYPLTIVDGLTSLSNTFYGVFKRRLHCPGKCANNKIELWNANPKDVLYAAAGSCGDGQDYIVYWSVIKQAGSFADMQELTVQLKEDSFHSAQFLSLLGNLGGNRRSSSATAKATMDKINAFYPELAADDTMVRTPEQLGDTHPATGLLGTYYMMVASHVIQSLRDSMIKEASQSLVEDLVPEFVEGNGENNDRKDENDDNNEGELGYPSCKQVNIENTSNKLTA